jgi:phosphopantetheine--protein transferase-like protein
MQFTTFGRTGVIVSRLCLGTATFGKQTDERVSHQILDKAEDAGINFIDTANFYPMGAEPTQLGSTEEITGRWLKGKRDRFIVATKAGAPMGPSPWDQGASRKHLLDAIDASLRRLGTDYVDLYQLHFDDPGTPLDETLEAMRKEMRRFADEEIIIREGERGESFFMIADGAGLDFNVSHSGDLALCAVTRARAVGVDVEAIRPGFATGEVARRFFAPAEVTAFEALPPGERVEAFFACWTCKEAYIKVRGAGIALGLDRFEVSLAPGRPAALLATHDEPAAAARWRLVALAPGEGYAGALATDGPARLACWQWPPAEAWPGTERNTCESR